MHHFLTYMASSHKHSCEKNSILNNKCAFSYSNFSYKIFTQIIKDI